MPSLQDWKELFKKRGTGVAVIGCMDSKNEKAFPRLVTEHAIGFPEKDDPAGYVSIFIRTPTRQIKEEHVLSSIANHGRFSLNFLRYDDLEIAKQLGVGNQNIEMDWVIDKHGTPQLQQCNMSLSCVCYSTHHLEDCAYDLVVARLVDYWENPIEGRALIFNKGQFGSFDRSSAVPVSKRLVSKPGAENPRL